jgi:hypothetical protein
MTDEIKFLLIKYENKMASFWQLDGEMNWCEDDRIYSMERRSRILDAEVKQARDDLVRAITKQLEAEEAHDRG